jgi:hypothetical protein
MASFTDAISTFNPYVQELPIEAMAQVGMYKQQQYDQGVQKIQSYIDNIAGMDIIKDPQKKYLQSKLDELGGNLKKFAAADFSDNQLVNSVGGMASQLARDPIIQSGVYSTARIRKGMQQVEADKKSGNYNPNNEVVFNDEVNKYLSDGKLDSSFTGQYDTFFDVAKFTKEQFDAVKPKGFRTNQIFKTDDAGNPKLMQARDAKGNPVGKPYYEYSDYMKTLESEGRTPEEVKATINTILSDGRVKKQLSIDGRATYRGYDAKALNQQIVSTKEDLIDNDYENLLGMLLYKTSGIKKVGQQDIEEVITGLQDKIKNTTESYDSMAKLALENPDAVKAKLYTDSFISNTTGQYGSVTTKEIISDNPAANYQFKLTQEANTILWNRIKLESEIRQKELDREQKDRLSDKTINAMLLGKTLSGKNAGSFTLVDSDGDGVFDAIGEGQGVPGGGGPGAGGAFAPRQGEQPTDINTYINSFEAGKEAAATNFTSSQSSLIWNMTLKNVPGNTAKLDKLRSANPNVPEAELIERMVSSVRRNPKESLDAWKARWINKSMIEYGKMSSKQRAANPDVVDAYNGFMTAQKNWTAISALDKQIEKDVTAQLGSEGARAASLKGVKPIVGEYQGKKFTLTPSQQYDLALYMKANASAIGINYGPIKSAGEAAGRRLSAQGLGFLLDESERRSGLYAAKNVAPISTVIRGVQSLYAGAKDLIGAQDYATLEWGSINNILDNLDEELVNKANDAKGAALKRRYAIQPNLEMSMMTGDLERDRATLYNLSEYTASAKEYDKNLSSRSDVKGFGEAVSDKDFLTNGGSIQVRVLNQESGNPMVEIVAGTAQDGRKGSIVLSRDQALQRGINVDALYESSDVKAIRDVSGAYNGKTTPLEVKSKQNYYSGNTWLNKGNFPALQGYPNDVRANFFQQNGKWYGQLYVKLPSGEVISRTTNGNPNLQATVQRTQSLSGVQIDTLIREQQ